MSHATRRWAAVLGLALAAPLAGQEKQAAPLDGPRFIAYDHNCVVHICDRLKELPHLHIPPDKVETHPFCLQPSLSANADYVAFTSLRPLQAAGKHSLDIYLWERKSNQLLTLVAANSFAHDDYPSLSADGNLIAFRSADEKATRTAGIRLYDRKAGKLLDLPNLSLHTNSGMPALCPDGRFLVFTAQTSRGDRDVYLYDREQARLIDLPNLNSSADEWSARIGKGGRWLAFCTRRPENKGNASLHLYDREKAGLVDLPGLPASGEHLECDLSADARFIALLTNRRQLQLYDRSSGKMIELPAVHHQGRIQFSPALSRE